MILADSDVLIDALRGVEPIRSRVEQLLSAGELSTTAITAFELRSGARTARQKEAVDAVLGPLPVVAFDGGAAPAPTPPSRKTPTGFCEVGIHQL